MEKPVIKQKLVLGITQICVAAAQNFPTQAWFQHKSDFEHKNFVCVNKREKAFDKFVKKLFVPYFNYGT
jgi:hypothetical protein